MPKISKWPQFPTFQQDCATRHLAIAEHLNLDMTLMQGRVEMRILKTLASKVTRHMNERIEQVIAAVSPKVLEELKNII